MLMSTVEVHNKSTRPDRMQVMVLLHGAIMTLCYYVFRNQLFRKYLQTIFKLPNLRNI